MRPHIARVALIAGLVGAAGATPAAVALASSAGGAAFTGGATSSARDLDVLPFPGTPDAAPATSIDFPATSPGQIASVTAVGSRSGLHAGHLSAQPAGRGSAFHPARPLRPGERVTVTAVLRSPAAGTASGAAGSRKLRWSFLVARPASVKSTVASAGVGDEAGLVPSGARRSGSAKTHSFVTHPRFHVPWISMHGKDTDTTSGDIFLDVQNSGQSAAMFLNPRGELRWYQHRGPSIFNTRVQRYNHHRVITFWQGRVVPPGIGMGQGRILNNSYQTIHTVRAGNGYRKHGTDFHEFTLGHEGSEGTAFVEIWSPVRANLTSVGGPATGTVFDWIIQEIDVATDKVIWEWHALGHVPISASYERYVPGQPYDYFHLNSIQQLPDGRILISARNTWAVYSIEKKSGKIAWELGGKYSSFNVWPGAGFRWQHDATLYGHGLLTVFDDGAPPQSRALEIHLGNHQATLVHAYMHKPSLLALSQGSTQLLRNRHVFVGWGSRSWFSEYAPSGGQIFSGSMRSPIQSYRAYRSVWVGHPLRRPALAVRKSSAAGKDRLYMSWNGATRVVKWRIEAGPAPDGPFTMLRTVPWRSFETSTRVLVAKGPYFRVQALSANGRALPRGTSGEVLAPSR